MSRFESDTHDAVSMLYVFVFSKDEIKLKPSYDMCNDFKGSKTFVIFKRF